MSPCKIKLECVSPECYLPKRTTVGLNGFFFLPSFVIFRIGISRPPLDLPTLENLTN
jgi:hypothetical protein